MYAYEWEEVYREDLDYRKMLAIQSRNKRNKGKPRLGKDYTKRQIKSMCGNVITYNFDRLLSKSEYLAMSFDLQSEYMRKLFDKYGIGVLQYFKSEGIAPSKSLLNGFKDNEIYSYSDSKEAKRFLGVEDIIRDTAIKPNRTIKVIEVNMVSRSNISVYVERLRM